ncbi:uncharacterized protein LOC117177251 [Belonocnema kinseyi]|uniref:uncharacterized protein LOC117177251 n=1 Tax=Belonocnema kinseyi TaxID=2817044 RepID=UPI00143CE541|nr:uncharacterized protein LOC117177251 [Belonocnema kinseyi]
MSTEVTETIRGPFFVDVETGESFDVQDHPQENGALAYLVNNVETGEPEVNDDTPRIHRKVPFKIPREVRENYAPAKKISEDCMDIESVLEGDSFGQINPICLFLPAIIYCKWCIAILLVMETILHVYSHRKNKILKDPSVYYQSPFHGISSQFCALCQSETCMNRVGKMQQARMHRFLRQCNYMKRVVT